jgi:hypothetical protein
VSYIITRWGESEEKRERKRERDIGLKWEAAY